MILLQNTVQNTAEVQPAGFAFWFITWMFGLAFIVILLYVFIVKNPKINPPRKRDEERD